LKTTANLAFRSENPFCALTLSALDSEPISRSARLLLTATARVANSGMRWNAMRTSLGEWGTPPPRIEPVAGTVTLRGLAGASRLTVQPLDGTGHPLGKSIDASKTAAGWDLSLGDPPTTWYLIGVHR
jgi:hypothetical protein